MCDSEVAGWTVLIVEDEPHNLGVPEGILQHYGAQVFTAEDGLEGLKVLADITPTLILLDLSMPQMDGWEMIKRVRADPKTANVPVVALTAHAWHRDKERVLAAGFDGYISKPFLLETFMREIKRCVREVESG